MRNKVIGAFLVFLLLCSFSLPVFAQDFYYFEEPNLYNIPKTLLRTDRGLDGIGSPPNPALLNAPTGFSFIHRSAYRGGNYEVSSDVYNDIAAAGGMMGPGHLSSSVDERWYRNALATEIGFVLGLNDASSLSVLFDYGYDSITGDGMFTTDYYRVWLAPPSIDTTHCTGSLEKEYASHAFGVSVVYDREITDTFSLGAGMRYAYLVDDSAADIDGYCLNPGTPPVPENVSVERDLRLSSHLVSPSLGMSMKLADWMDMNVFVTSAFRFGNVERDSILYDDYNVVAFPIPYTDDLESNDLFGWDIDARLELAVDIPPSEALSIPLVVDFSISDTKWEVDGVGSGFFDPHAYFGVFHGPGPVSYEYSFKNWDISAGSGLRYTTDDLTVSALVSYSHLYIDTSYEEYNTVVSGPPNVLGLHGITEKITENRDVVSLALGFKAPLGPVLFLDSILQTDFGWGRMDYDATHLSLVTANGDTEYFEAAGDDFYCDMTLDLSLTYQPTSRLSLSLSGMCTVPIDPLDYDLAGSSYEDPTMTINMYGHPMRGTSIRGVKTVGWEYGGMFSVKYLF